MIVKLLKDTIVDGKLRVKGELFNSKNLISNAVIVKKKKVNKHDKIK